MQPKSYITTYKKHRFSPLDARPEHIDIEDIAHALSLMCRANGHFGTFFSVARHCINCCHEGEALGLHPRLLMTLLLHDASEAYISDLTRPVKLGIPLYCEIEERLQSVIWSRFGLAPTESDLYTVKVIDDMMLKLEFAHFANEVIAIETDSPRIPPEFDRKSFEEDEQEFLKLYNELKTCR
jgi:hypothetical protein